MPKTLIPPPKNDASKAPIENVLELTSLKIIDKDLFTNTRPLWHPPGARGIYGGAAIAQSLAAAQLTIPPPSPENGFAKFYVHSLHSYFVLAGNADIPVVYAVERVREGRSFMTRTVQARQEGRCIFTVTLSFARADSGGREKVEHEAQLPEGVLQGLEDILAAEKREGKSGEADSEANGPFEHKRIALTNGESTLASRFEQRLQRHRVEGGLKEAAEVQSEYIRRNWGNWGQTVPPSKASMGMGQWTLEDPVKQGESHSGMTTGGMTEKFWKRDPVESLDRNGASSKRPETKRTQQWVKARGKITAAAGQEAHLSALAYMSDSWFIGTVARVQNLWRFSSPRASVDKPAAATPAKSDYSEDNKDLAHLEDVENREAKGPPRRIGMMVSLDHSIYFHKPASIKADEWLFQEMESPWAGDGRGLVIQKIWNRQGELLATCIQEGVIRLEQNKAKGKL